MKQSEDFLLSADDEDLEKEEILRLMVIRYMVTSDLSDEVHEISLIRRAMTRMQLSGEVEVI